MTEPREPLRPAPGEGRTFLGVRRIEPQDDGVHLYDDDGREVGVVAYGEDVYVNGRVMSFSAKRQDDDQRSRG